MNAMHKTPAGYRFAYQRRERGQAMVFTLAFGVATALITLVLFNSGVLANAKGRLQNAVDAGAYSAGILQARDHNFSAYTNRAMVANQVAVVQLASLKSYLEDAANTRERMDGLLDFYHLVYPVSAPMWQAGKSSQIDLVNSNYASVAPTAVRALDKLIAAYETAQQAHHLATVADMAMVADEVIQRNDPQASMTHGTFYTTRTAYQVTNWGNSTSRFAASGTSQPSDRFADTVVSEKSTDQFSRNRLSTPTPKWASTVKQPFPCVPVNLVFNQTIFAFRHAGGTILSSDKKRWLALDATQGDGFWLCIYVVPCPLGTCVITEGGSLDDINFPAMGGSGGAVVGAGGDYDEAIGYKNNPSETARYGNSLFLVPSPANRRYQFTGPGSSLDGAGGLQDYYRDVTNPGGSLPKNQTAEENGAAYGVTIEAERTAASLRTSSKILADSDQLKLTDGMKGDTMRALAGAQSYFYRNRENASRFTLGGWIRADGKTEVSNLFSPYWQARLADRSDADRTASWGAQ